MLTIHSQVCTKCPGEKPLSMFHRRAAGYQRICKACRSSQSKSDYGSRGRARVTKAIRQVNRAGLPEMSERISALAPKIRKIALRFANDKHEVEDLFQIMVEAILKRCEPEHNDGFILMCARWAGQGALRSNLTYNFHVETIAQDDEAEGAELAVARSVEEEVIQAELSTELRTIIAQLPREYQEVVKLLSIGLSQREISRKFEISEQAISEKMGRIRKLLVGAGLPI